MGTYSGDGTVEGHGEPEAVLYHLVTVDDGRMRTGSGTLAADYALLARLFGGDRCTLVMENGIRVPIIVRSLSGVGPARFQMAGAPVHPNGTTADL